jgi:hypothetical protein
VTCVIACVQKLGRESKAILETKEVNSGDNVSEYFYYTHANDLTTIDCKCPK